MASFITCETSTQLEPVVMLQKWMLPNAATQMKNEDEIYKLKDTYFSHDKLPNTKFQLCIYPNGKQGDKSRRLSVFLKMSATSIPVGMRIQYCLSTVDDNNKIRVFENDYVDLYAGAGEVDECGVRRIHEARILATIRNDGSILLLCHVKALPHISLIEIVSRSESSQNFAESAVAKKSTIIAKKWEINNFKDMLILSSLGTSHCTKAFGDPKIATFRLLIYPIGKNIADRNSVSIGLQVISSKDNEVDTSYGLYLMNDDGSISFLCKNSGKFGSGHLEITNIAREKAMKAIRVDKSLVIVARLEVTGNGRMEGRDGGFGGKCVGTSREDR